MQRDLGRALPLPLVAEPLDVELGDERLVVDTVGAATRTGRARSASGTNASAVGVAWTRASGAAARRPPLGGVEERRHQLGGPLAHDAADVERVAHLAVERVHDAGDEPVGVGVGGGHHPRPAGAVQADRHAGLAGDRAELRDRRARAAGDGQRQPSVGEQRPAGGVRGGRRPG